MQQFTDNPKKRPVATVGFCEDLYLRSRVRHQILKVAVPPLSRNDWPAYEYLRDLARRLRPNWNSKGMAKWAILLFAGCCFGFMALLAVSHQPHIYTFTAPQDTFRVVAQDSDFNFVLQQVHEGVPQKEAVYHFCPSQPMPRFQIGETLDQLIYEDKGECQQLARGIPYIIERDETLPGHWPKLAGNCVNLGAKQPVVCDGKPQF